MRHEKLAAVRALRTQRGFSLLESMVALLVLSVGLIGIAALHTRGLSANRTAVYRNIAVSLSADMTDRIRANRVAGTAYNGTGESKGCDSGSSCSSTDLALHDLFLWEGLVESMLPNGEGTVAADDSTDPITYTITVTWDEAGDGEVSHETVVQVPQF